MALTELDIYYKGAGLRFNDRGRSFNLVEGNAVTVSAARAQELMDSYPDDVTLGKTVQVWTAQTVTASTGESSGTATNGEAYSKLTYSGSVTIAGSTGNCELYVYASDDNSTWVPIPFWDLTAGVATAVAIKNFTTNGSFVFEVTSKHPYVKLFCDNDRDAQATLNAWVEVEH
jgi:hypothetical protein